MSSSRSRHLYFVRHGQYTPSPGGGVLTELGRKQAARTGKRLARLALQGLLSSDLDRARETARLIADELPAPPRLRHARLLREMMPTGWPGIRVPLAARAAGKRKIETIVARYFKPSRSERHEVIVCHGNLIRTIACRSIGASWTTWRELSTHHCGITRLEVRPDGRVLLVSYNDTGHLPDSWVTAG